MLRPLIRLPNELKESDPFATADGTGRGEASGGGPHGNSSPDHRVDRRVLASAFDYDRACRLYNTERYAECVALCKTGVAGVGACGAVVEGGGGPGNAVHVSSDPKAAYLLGRCHLYGRGAAENDAEALKLLSASALREAPLGQQLLGACYEHGASSRGPVLPFFLGWAVPFELL